MDMTTQLRPIYALCFFVSQASLDWLYVLWIKAQPIINNSWLVVIPIMGYFFLTFTLIAAYYMYMRSKLGLNIGYVVLLFGMIADVMSYSLVHQRHDLIEFLIVPLIITNLCVMAYMAYSQTYYTID
jgi:hypothetical protein